MNTKRTNRFLICLTCLLLVFTPMCALAAATTDATPTEAPAVNAFDMISQNTKLDLSPYKGKAIFLNFFTEWCGYCMKEMPDIKAAYDMYNADDLQIILVHVWDGETEKETASVQEKFGMQDMIFFEDSDRALAEFVGLQGYPASLFIAKDGILNAAMNYMVTPEAIAEQMTAMVVSKKELAE